MRSRKPSPAVQTAAGQVSEQEQAKISGNKLRLINEVDKEGVEVHNG